MCSSDLLIRLDKMVGNEAWALMFPEAKVCHVSMSASDQCLLALSLNKVQLSRRRKKRFFFKEMWTRVDECKEIIELAWDPYTEDSVMSVQERIERCKTSLQHWKQTCFGNVYKGLKQKQNHLQQLKSLNLLHETAEEIQSLKKEINELHTREEVMWKQRSRIAWLQYGDKNSKFFHATTSQRRQKNRIGGLVDELGVWHNDQESTERLI